MDLELVQRTRYLLRSRFRRAQSCPEALFISACKQLYTWLVNHPIMAAHLQHLKLFPGPGVVQVHQILTDLNSMTSTYYDPGFYSASTMEDHAAVCLAILEVLADEQVPPEPRFLYSCLGEYLTREENLKPEDAVQTIRDVALDGLFEYLDENLDARNVVLALLQKYKQRCEWFHRHRLRDSAQTGVEGKTGERALALDLYEYLLDQSVEFFVEPVSGTGEADLVLREPAGRYIVVDAKYLKASDSRSELKRKLVSGFHQVARYCDDYNEPSGYLVAFSESRLRLALELEEADGWPVLQLGARAVYFVEIWITDSPSASKLGRAEELVLTRTDLLHSPEA